tara:strand:- start:201 stop:434 length:234 start_codon:yes stop_codon:yes gene_type:complete
MIFKKARRHLKKNDKVLGKRINAVGICTLTPLKRDHFDVLVSSIISQQISAKAAKTIKNPLLIISGDDNTFDPKKLL